MGRDSFNHIREQRGVIVIVVALLILVFIGAAALAIDVGHLFLVHNELQNSADAGCLAGARFLYSDDGMSVNENANQIAYQAAIANKSERVPVDVHWSGGNTGDVERGHWSFATRTFTPNESTQPVPLWDVSPEALDANLNFYRRMSQREKQRAYVEAEEEGSKENLQTTAEGYERLGDSYLRQGHTEMAFLQYDKALRIDPNQMNIRYKIGRLFLEKGLVEEGKKEFEAILKADPDHALAYLGMGWASFKKGEFEKAEKNLQHAVELNAGLWQAHPLRGFIYDHQRQFDAAILEYRKAIALRPNESSLFNNLGVSFLLKGDYEEAVGSFNEALKFETNRDKVHNNLALALCKLRRYPEAIEVFKKGGSEASAYNNVGFVLLMDGNYQKTIEAFERSLEINPGFYLRAYENLNKAKTAYTPPSQK